MTNSNRSGTFSLGSRTVNRIGYGAMQLTGPGVFGPPADRQGALAVLRAAVDAGVNHIDTSDFYGPHITNQLISEALYPYRDTLTIVTKVGALRTGDGGIYAACSAAQLTAAVHDNLRNLRLDVLDVVNFRYMAGGIPPDGGAIEAPVAALAALQQQGLIRHIGLSNVTASQLAEAQKITPIVCVQNRYNIVQRHDDALLDECARQGIAWVPFFPLGGFTPVQSSALQQIAGRLGAAPMQIALAWLLQRSANILLIPGTRSVAHLHENLAAGALILPADAIAVLDQLAL
ncbi:oxidoreductase [Shimwellia pseudoproteus]|uniref:oxidoreductase n=1 Tax=Shimwellia pseudoproteus TaxID=570012 RepID=UPI0018ED42B7|nr:oxidoreductase [Shimwellia pseudoproteus]MBJ3815997.1 oxidoreductase [Shimwellia pseudoproteus]